MRARDAGIALTMLLATTTVHAAPPAPSASATTEQRVARLFESLRDQPPQLLAFLREMPKGADLHNHLSGSIYAETLLQWAAEDGDCLGTETLALTGPPCDPAVGRPPASAAMADQAFYARAVDAWSMRNWQRGSLRSGHDHFFSTFGLDFRATKGHAGDMVAEAARLAAADHVSYVELMVTPDTDSVIKVGATVGWDDDLARLRTKMLEGGMADAVATVRAEFVADDARKDAVHRCGTPQAEAACSVEVRYIYQVLRGLPREQVFAQILAGFETASREPRVVGLNLVMPEDWRVPMQDFRLHMRMIDALRASYPSVHVTLHAGELWAGLVPPEGLRFHIREAIGTGHAERIGHGTAVMFEDRPHELLREMARRGILVEVSLYSADGILGVRGADHPLSAYLAAGVPVALCTDDEGVSRSDMTMEYVKAAREQKLGYVALKKIARAGLEHAFVDEATRARLLRTFDADVKRFEAAVLAPQAPRTYTGSGKVAAKSMPGASPVTSSSQ